MKIRASMVSAIMVQPKTIRARQAGELAKTGQTYLQKLWIENLFGVHEDIETDAMKKGIEAENESISLLSEFLGYVSPLVKNTVQLENDWISGSADIVLSDEIIDVKTSWNLFTFPHFMTKVPSSYYWQLQSYMWLYAKKYARLAYCLVNTPREIIEKIINKKAFGLQEHELDGEWLMNLEKQHNFDEIPIDKRVKIFEVERNENDIARIPEQVEKARVYYEQLGE